MGIVRLLAEVLFAGKGCPKCGGEKTERARTCRTCFEEIGTAATMAVEEVAFECARAAIGHKTAISTENAYKRDVVWGPILCQVKVDHAMYKEPDNSVGNYWDCSIYMPDNPRGGYISMFIFGGGQYGQVVTVLLEKKTKQTGKGKITYFRGQVVDNITSNVRLHVDTYANYDKANFVEALPHERQVELGHSWSVGFVPMPETTEEAQPVAQEEENKETNQASAAV